jgi:glucose-6-phosphate 1-dehydrogenase
LMSHSSQPNLFIDSWRWAGAPIYIRAGKALPVTATEVMVDFKRPPRESFAEIVPPASDHMRIRIIPDVTIALSVRVKRPGEGMRGEDVELILTEQASAFMPPYQRLLGPPVTYTQGSWGPEEANQLIGPDAPWHKPKPTALRP